MAATLRPVPFCASSPPNSPLRDLLAVSFKSRSRRESYVSETPGTGRLPPGAPPFDRARARPHRAHAQIESEQWPSGDKWRDDGANRWMSAWGRTQRLIKSGPKSAARSARIRATGEQVNAMQELAKLRLKLQGLDRASTVLVLRVAEAGELGPLLDQLRDARARRDDLTRAITSLEHVDDRTFDRQRIAERVREHVEHWRSLLSTNQVQDGRRVLREMLDGPSGSRQRGPILSV